MSNRDEKEELIRKYMALPYQLEIVPDGEGTFIGRYPELPGCLTAGDTEEEVIVNAEDAKRVWLEAAIDSDYPIPLPSKQTDRNDENQRDGMKKINAEIDAVRKKSNPENMKTLEDYERQQMEDPEFTKAYEGLTEEMSLYDEIIEGLDEAIEYESGKTGKKLKSTIVTLNRTFNEKDEMEKNMVCDALERWKAEGHTEGLAEGLAEGLVKGQAKGIAKVISYKLKKGQTPEFIADDIGVSIEEVMKVAESIKKEME